MKVNEDYTGREAIVLAGTALDLTANGIGERIRYIYPCGATATLQGRIRNSTAGHSSTGIYTGADAECVLQNGETKCDFDKLYVQTGSAPVRVRIVTDGGM